MSIAVNGRSSVKLSNWQLDTTDTRTDTVLLLRHIRVTIAERSFSYSQALSDKSIMSSVSEPSASTAFTFCDFVPKQEETWRKAELDNGTVAHMYITESMSSLLERANATAASLG